MRKTLTIFLFFLIVALVVSCDADEVSALMDKMGNNLYGSQSSTIATTDVDRKLSESVINDTEGNATINWESLSTVVDTIYESLDSRQEREAIVQKLSESLTEDEDDSQQITQEMKDKVTELVNTLKEVASRHEHSNANVSSAVSLANTLALYSENISNPSKGDLVVLLSMEHLCENITDFYDGKIDANTMKTENLKILKLFKTVTMAASLNESINSIDITSVLRKTKDIFSDENIELGKKLIRISLSVLLELKASMEEDGVYSEEAYNKVIRDLSVLKATYELYAFSANIEAQTNTPYDAIVECIQIINGRGYPGKEDTASDSITFSDILMYAISVAATYHDGFYTALCGVDALVQGNIDDFEANDIQTDALLTLLSPLAKLDLTTDADQIAFFNTMAILLDVSEWNVTLRNIAGKSITIENALSIFY